VVFAPRRRIALSFYVPTRDDASTVGHAKRSLCGFAIRAQCSTMVIDPHRPVENNRIMTTVLESQIRLREREPVSPDVREIEDLIAFALTALARLEKHLGPGGLSELDRALVPLFQRWLSAAGKVKELARAMRSTGATVNGYDELLRAMNRSKPVAESFEHFVELNRRLASAGSATNGG
jgi:hypothetical protein